MRVVQNRKASEKDCWCELSYNDIIKFVKKSFLGKTICSIMNFGKHKM